MDNAKIVELIQRIEKGDFDEIPLYSYSEMKTLGDNKQNFALFMGFFMGLFAGCFTVFVLVIHKIISV